MVLIFVSFFGKWTKSIAIYIYLYINTQSITKRNDEFGYDAE